MSSRSIRPAAVAMAAAAATTVAAALIMNPAPASAAATVTNPGFEAGGATPTPAGWTETGKADASFTESGGHTGGFRLTHGAATAYRVETAQRLTGLGKGTYTLRAWVRSSGGQHTTRVALRDCGSNEQRVTVPVTGAESWVQVAVSTKVTGGRCTIAVYSDAGPGNWINVDDIEFARSTAKPGADVEIQGADISHLAKNEAFGAVYRDPAGREMDALRILRNNNVNYARLKVWVNPKDGSNSKAQVLAMAKRVTEKKMKLLINFHYSDAWADPGQQHKPAAWAALPFDQLRQAVYDHTYDVLAALKAQGTPADMAQVGNELNSGMLHPDGRWDNWDGLAALLTSGSTAVKAASPTTQVALHLAKGGDNGGHRWWFDNAISRGVPFDVIAVSHYTYWHGSLGSLQHNLFDLAERYQRPVVVVETAYGFTLAENDHQENIFKAADAQVGGYPATPEGQAQAVRDMFTVVAAVPNGRGLGVFYWEPTWTAVAGAGWDPADPASGDGWENQALFDYSGKALPALRVYREF